MLGPRPAANIGLASKSAERQDNDPCHGVYHNLGWCYIVAKEISVTLKIE